MKFSEPCTHCGSTESTKNGENTSGTQRRKCLTCGKGFTIYESKMLKGDLTYEDREVQQFTYEDFIDKYKNDQAFNDKLNYNQKTLHASIDTKKPIILQTLADVQFGGPNIDVELFDKYTNYIVDTPNLYVAILGDFLDSFFSGFYSAKPVHRQIFTPEQQYLFFKKWLDKVQHKILFATWDNHSDMRYEKVLGWSPSAMLQAKYAPYFDGHAQIFLKVGETEYHIVASHYFKGKSKYNPLHGLMSFAREQVQTADIYMQGDQHQASVGHFGLGGKDRVYIMTGTLQNGDDYTNRFYTPFSQKEMPCIVLHPETRKMIPFRTMEAGGIYINGIK